MSSAGKLAAMQDRPWQTDTSISYKSWGYLKDDALRTPKSILQDLSDIVSKNGCLLLNVGPKPDGTISEEEQKILLAVGAWLDRNGEAIYGSRPWSKFGEGPTQVKEGSLNEGEQRPFTAEDVRYTQKNGALYAIVLDLPADGRVQLQALAGAKPRSVRLLGASEPVKFTSGPNALDVELPSAQGQDLLPALKIELEQGTK